jgi:hypothetical protein
MATPRQFGQELNQNVHHGPNISPGACQAIITKRQCGVTVMKLAAEFGRSESAIKYTICIYNSTTTQKKLVAAVPAYFQSIRKRLHNDRGVQR